MAQRSTSGRNYARAKMCKLHFKDKYVCDPHNVATELTLIEKNLACSTEELDALLVEMCKELEKKRG